MKLWFENNIETLNDFLNVLIPFFKGNIWQTPFHENRIPNLFHSSMTFLEFLLEKNVICLNYLQKQTAETEDVKQFQKECAELLISKSNFELLVERIDQNVNLKYIAASKDEISKNTKLFYKVHICVFVNRVQY